jgi:hypothetical protein
VTFDRVVANERPSRVTDSQLFKIDRSQRMHSNGVVVRVYQVFAAERYGWDTNRDQQPPGQPLLESREAAERDCDDAMRRSGHDCDDGCYSWRELA